MLRLTTAALLFSGAYALSVSNSSGRNNSAVTSPGDHYVYASDFASGTFRITEPGKYVLYQNVEFEPSGSGVTETLFPDKNSKKYPQFGGYFLGFFAAITVEADDVEIDCKGHEIKMSEKFHKHQRFFSIIELGSKPFISGQGPPQFSSYITSPGAVKSAKNVVISNCKLGRSSHHGIHGNNNDGVTLRNVEVKDFEVGGISLNGAKNVDIEDADIGPSLGNTFRASLSQAIFLDHLANSLLPQHLDLNIYATTTTVVLQQKTVTVKSVFERLREQLRKFLAHGDGDLAHVFGSGNELPDGSAVYGIMLHTVGAAVADFGAGCAIGEEADAMVGPAKIKNVRIHDLKLAVDQVTRTVIGDGPQVMGPAGDVIQLPQIWNKDTYAYVGNPLSDAQVALAVLKDAVSSWKAAQPITWSEAKYYFGNVNVPMEVQDWAGGKLSSNEAFKDSLVKEKAFKCDGDAMTHHNKGAVGLRLEFQDGLDISNVKIESLMNVGKKDAEPYCDAQQYIGNDVRGVHLTHCKGFNKDQVEVVEASLNAPNGAVIPIAMIQLDRTSHVSRQQMGRRLRRAPSASTGGMLADDMSPL